MIWHRLFPRLLIVLLVALRMSAQSVPPARVTNLQTSDSTILKATYFGAGKPGPGVLLLHQCNRQRKVWDELAQQLAVAGINVLTVDLRGFGESGGTPFDKLDQQENAKIQAEKWPGDIDTAFQYLVSQEGVRRDTIGVGGASCGFNNSIRTAQRHPGEVKSLVLLSGGTDLAGRQFLRQASNLPALFSFADDDEFSPTTDIVPWLFTIDASPEKKLVRYPTGGHGAEMFAVHPELRTVIVDWYVNTLIQTPGHAKVDKNSWPVLPYAQILNQLETPGGVQQVVKQLAEARRSDPKTTIFPEAVINQIGYEHLLTGDIKGGVEILRLNVTAFPESPNAYDSLSDAYLADGQKEQARQTVKKTLDLLDHDTKDPEPFRKGLRDVSLQKLKELDAGKH